MDPRHKSLPSGGTRQRRVPGAGDDGGEVWMNGCIPYPPEKTEKNATSDSEPTRASSVVTRLSTEARTPG